MAATINVEKTGELEFTVRVTEPSGESIHCVTVTQEDYDRLTGGKIKPEKLVQKSLQFLLEREPKELILSHFDLSVIRRYFPEFERKIKGRLSNP